MKMEILKIIIWPKDEKKEPRFINFQPNAINLITGTSRTGKTSIVEILDYCLGSGGCSIPKIGPIRKSSSWYGLLIQTVEGKKLLARRDPIQQDSTDDYCLIEGIDIEIPQTPYKNANREVVRGILSRLGELPQADSDFFETGSGYKGRVSFGDLTAFIFQTQDIVASKNTLFYQANEEEHARKLREIFPLILGAVDSDVLMKQHRLQEIRRILERKRRQLEDLKTGIEDFKGEVRGRYIAAIDLGLARPTTSSLDEDSTDIFLNRLKEVLANWGSDQQDIINGETNFVGSERLSILQERETKLSSELSSLKIRHTQLKELFIARSSLESNVSRERDRLSSVSWLMEKLENANSCPICGSQSDVSREELIMLKKTTQEVEALWNGIHIIPPMLDAEDIEVKKNIQRIEDLLRQVRLEITQIEQERNLDRTTRNQRAIFIGRLEEFFNFRKNISDGGNLYNEITALEAEEKDLLESIDSSIIAQRKEAALFRVSRFAQFYGDIMQLETGDDPIQLDTNKLTIRVISEDGKISWLKEIGSAANWLGYHVATLLALHEMFENQKIPYVPGLLVLDQPSQTHFPDDTDEEAEDEEFEAVKKAFQACSQAINRINNSFQVIITDHAGGSVVQGVQNVHIVERWRKGRKLIPWHWHPEALKVCIEQHSKADAAIEDIMDSCLKPAIINFLNLQDENQLEIEITDSSFNENGISFEAKLILADKSQNINISGSINPNLDVLIDPFQL
jgi:hypothetical protein